jgi:ABC-type nitrate/sulfonate/bicarbonate transport system permease component
MADTTVELAEVRGTVADAGTRAAQVRRFEPGRPERDPARYVRRRRWLEIGLAWAVPILLITMWQVAANNRWIDVRFFPGPKAIVDASRDLISSGTLFDAMWASTKRILGGYAIGVVTGVAAGLILGVSGLIRAALEPTLMTLYVVPKIAILPLLLLIFGLGDKPKIISVAITVFFFMWIQTMEAVIATNNGYKEAMRSFDANAWQMFRYVYLPSSLPQIFVAARLCAGISVLVMVSVEFVQGDDGVGYLIWNSWSLFLATRMYVGIVAVSLMGLVFSMIVKGIGRRVLPWAPNDKTHGLT